MQSDESSSISDSSSSSDETNSKEADSSPDLTDASSSDEGEVASASALPSQRQTIQNATPLFYSNTNALRLDADDSILDCNIDKNTVQFESEILGYTHKILEEFKKLPSHPPEFSMYMRLNEESKQFWRVFSKQKDARLCVKLFKDLGVMPFAFHTIGGRRLFVATHPLTLHNMIRSRKHAYCYEIIANLKPSKIYLDLEFDRKSNPNIKVFEDTNKMIAIFNQFLSYTLSNLYGIIVNQNKNILILDATTDKKFSTHVIFQLSPNLIIFRSNIHVSTPVISTCNMLRNIKEFKAKSEHFKVLHNLGLSIEDVEMLFINRTDKKPALFVDEGVYTKNRHFRVYGCEKYGMNNPLKINYNTNNNFPCPFGEKGSVIYEEFYFLTSLVTYNDSIEYYIPELTSYKYNFCARPIPKHCGELTESPYPLLNKLVRRFLAPCTIQVVVNYNDGKYYGFFTRENGICSSSSLHHKSSRVIIIADCQKGIFYQKCHSKECLDDITLDRMLPTAVKKELGLIGDDTNQWDRIMEDETSKVCQKLIKSLEIKKQLDDKEHTQSHQKMEEEFDKLLSFSKKKTTKK